MVQEHISFKDTIRSSTLDISKIDSIEQGSTVSASEGLMPMIGVSILKFASGDLMNLTGNFSLSLIKKLPMLHEF